MCRLLRFVPVLMSELSNVQWCSFARSWPRNRQCVSPLDCRGDLPRQLGAQWIEIVKWLEIVKVSVSPTVAVIFPLTVCMVILIRCRLMLWSIISRAVDTRQSRDQL
eukprot:3301916-Amphidinium_carterae.1